MNRREGARGTQKSVSETAGAALGDVGDPKRSREAILSGSGMISDPKIGF